MPNILKVWRRCQAPTERTIKSLAAASGKTGVMPPKGGNPALSDEQMKATVAWMVEQSK